MTRTQTLLITLILASVIHSKILVMDMEDLRKLSASNGTNLLRSLLNPENAAHDKGMSTCVASDGRRWQGFVDRTNKVCKPWKCHIKKPFETNLVDVDCVTVE